MTHFIDIDGSHVMAGSPDMMACVAIAIRDLLGDYARPGTPRADPKSLSYAPFLRLKAVRETDDNRLALVRIREAEMLLRLAAELLDGLSHDGMVRDKCWR